MTLGFISVAEFRKGLYLKGVVIGKTRYITIGGELMQMVVVEVTCSSLD